MKRVLIRFIAYYVSLRKVAAEIPNKLSFLLLRSTKRRIDKVVTKVMIF